MEENINLTMIWFLIYILKINELFGINLFITKRFYFQVDFLYFKKNKNMMKKIKYVMLLPFLFLSCIKENNKAEVLNNYFELSFVDTSGQDLLDFHTINHFCIDSIKLYRIKKGIRTEIFNDKLDYPRNFMVFKNNTIGRNFIRIFLDCDTTLLYLDANNIDTIKCKIEQVENGQILKKLWYNGVLEWEYGQEAPILTKVKTKKIR